MSSLRAGTPVTVSHVTIIPVEKLSGDSRAAKRGFWLYGAKEPVAVVICDPGGQRALSLAGNELRISDLVSEVPGLSEMLARFSTP